MAHRDSSPKVLVVVAGLAITLSGSARALDCTSATANSPCFDADTLAPPFAPSEFFTMPSARALSEKAWSFGLVLGFSKRPVSLHAASADPYGRDVRVVDNVFDATLAAAWAPARRLELGLALPFSLYRSGTGLSAVTSQTGSDLAATSFRDLRLGAGYEWFHLAFAGGGTASVLGRLDSTLPTGASSAFAGEGAPVVAPAIDVGVRFGRFFASAEERTRLREPVAFGGNRLGTQFVSALGVGGDIVGNGALSVALEAFVAPYLAAPARTLTDGTRVDPGTLVPAEWVLSVRGQSGAFVGGLGGGTAIPLSSETRTSASGARSSSTYAPVTTPEYRFMLTLRYVVPDSKRDGAPASR